MSLLSRIEALVRDRRLYFFLFFSFSSWRGSFCYADGEHGMLGTSNERVTPTTSTIQLPHQSREVGDRLRG
jgi:hypothetical protein